MLKLFHIFHENTILQKKWNKFSIQSECSKKLLSLSNWVNFYFGGFFDTQFIIFDDLNPTFKNLLSSVFVIVRLLK